MFIKRTYKSFNAKIVPWDKIEQHYIIHWNGKHKKLLELVKHIRTSGLQDKLYGVTSMDKLIISNYTPLDMMQDCLHITFDLRANKWNFEYHSKPFLKPEFVRTYAEDKGIEKLNQFIEYIKW